MADQCLGPVPIAIRYKLLSLLRPYPADEMTAYPISTLVNSPKNDVPACIEAATMFLQVECSPLFADSRNAVNRLPPLGVVD